MKCIPQKTRQYGSLLKVCYLKSSKGRLALEEEPLTTREKSQ